MWKILVLSIQTSSVQRETLHSTQHSRVEIVEHIWFFSLVHFLHYNLRISVKWNEENISRCLLYRVNANNFLFSTFVSTVFSNSNAMFFIIFHIILNLFLVLVTINSRLIRLVSVRDDCGIEAPFISSWRMWWTVYNKSFAWSILTSRDLYSQLFYWYSKLFFYCHCFFSGILTTKDLCP